MLQIAQVRILVPLTPTMIRLLLPGANVAAVAQLAIEFLNGYELILEGALPPIDFARGQIRLLASSELTDRGPYYKGFAKAKPLDLEFGLGEELAGYLKIFGLVEAEVLVRREVFGFSAEFFLELFTVRTYFFIQGQLMGGSFAPTSIADSSFEVKALFDAAQFNDMIVGPVNDFIRVFASGLQELLRFIPIIGNSLADFVDTALNIILIELDNVSVEAFLGPTLPSSSTRLRLARGARSAWPTR